MLWFDLLVIRWLLWRGQTVRATTYATRVILELHRFVEEESARIAKAAGIDVPRPKETRVVRASADVFKLGQVLTIDGRPFAVARLLSASRREVIYEVVSQ